MIKPFKIESVREEPDGGKTVFFTVNKYEHKEDGSFSKTTMTTAMYVDSDKDIDETIFEDLKKTGWI